METLLTVVWQVGLLPETRLVTAIALADEVGRMLWALIQRLGTQRIQP